MGVYASGVLFWGIAFTDSGKPPWHESGDADDFDWQSRLDRRRDALELPETHGAGCTVGYHVAYDTPMAYVAIERSIRGADDTAAGPVGAVDVDPDWERMLREFCDVLGIPWSTPGWRLVSVINH